MKMETNISIKNFPLSNPSKNFYMSTMSEIGFSFPSNLNRLSFMKM